MARRGHPVKDHARNGDVRVKRRQTGHDGGMGERGMCGVDDHDNRGSGRRGDFGAGAAASPKLTVEEPHNPLNDRDISPVRGDETVG